MTTSAHLFALVATLPSLILIISLVRRGALRVKYALVWMPVGVAMLLFSVIPGLLDQVAGAVGVAYPPTVLFVLALGLLIFVAVHLSWELSRLDERIRRLAESIAIVNADHPLQDLPVTERPRQPHQHGDLADARGPVSVR